jgi:hypothetical protein
MNKAIPPSAGAAPDSDIAREAERQRWLLQALWQRGPLRNAADWLVPLRPAAFDQAGVPAYRTNAYVAAERALSSSFPTVAALIGAEAMAPLAKAYRQAHPPARGDLAWLGEALPEFIATSADLAELPYLADVARLDWTLAQAEAAADAEPDHATLALLAELDPAEICLQLAPGAVLLVSAWPVVMLWQAHQTPAESDWAPVRQALAERRAETALVWRQGWRMQAVALDAAQARLLGALLGGASLAAALAEAGPELDFTAWLVAALRDGLLLAATRY